MATSIQLKGSLFDEELLGTIEAETPPEGGDVIECQGKSFTVTDLLHEGAEGFALTTDANAELGSVVVAIVEPLAVSQRRASIFPPR